MRFFVLLLTLIASALLLGCGSSGPQPEPSGAGAAAPLPTATVSRPAQSSIEHSTAPSAETAPPVSVAHGGQAAGSPDNKTAAPPPGQAAADTAALDKKIEQAEAKAKAKNAKQADKLAAAAAYLERANLFYNAGQPSLYKFALRDYRRTLRYDPNNKVAQENLNTIVSIYNSMQRPVPELGNEP
ncbi:MAG TPA: hypothetical protein VF723_01740 [Pyrinomonadaceae bacterium]|jgi:hypothetical protein